MIESWPNIEAYEILAGEPAMTIIPNLLLSGILSVFVSLLLIAWAIRGIKRMHGGVILLFLLFLLLLVGGGFAPPLIGVVVGAFTIRMNRTSGWSGGNGILGRSWPYLFVSSILGYLSLWPGLVIASLFLQVDPTIVIVLTLLSCAALILALVSSFSYSGRNQNQS